MEKGTDAKRGVNPERMVAVVLGAGIHMANYGNK